MTDELLTRLEQLTGESKGLSSREFLRLMKEDGNTSIPTSQLSKGYRFAYDQLAFWQAEWSFSRADSPDSVAKIEVECWEILCRSFFDSLVEIIPDQQEKIEGLQGKILLHHAMRRRLEYNEGKTFRNLTARLLSEISFVFNRLGLSSIARNLYARALYPKGTVARP
jgi:hypothetical protein